jgi:hypothetical protein
LSGEIVLQVGIIQQIYPVHLLVIVVLISKQKHLCWKAKWWMEFGWEGGGGGVKKNLLTW